MNKEILYGIIGLLVGVVIAIIFTSYNVNNNNSSMMRMMGINTRNVMGDDENTDGRDMMGMGSSMTDMMDTLEEKTGDTFDKAFISSMIIHHQGAIEMAQEAKNNAKHDEIKNLAGDIIKAQTAEIKQMRQWQSDWGY